MFLASKYTFLISYLSQWFWHMLNYIQVDFIFKNMDSDARPPEKLSNEGDLSKNWKLWKKEFQIYMKITKGYEKPECEQVAWLKNFIGPVGMDAFEKLSFGDPKDEEKMSVVLEKLEQFFNHQKNETEERLKFFSKLKEDNQSIESFIQELMEISKYCNFGDQREKLIQVVVVKNIKDKNLQQLLFEEGDLSLDKLRIFYKTYEKIRGVSKEVVTEKPELKKANKESFGSKCWRCRKEHSFNSCPAYGKMCTNCKNYHHFYYACPFGKLGYGKY